LFSLLVSYCPTMTHLAPTSGGLRPVVYSVA